MTIQPPAPPVKVCRSCEVARSAEEFDPSRRVCKVCRRASRLQWVRENPAEHSARTREWQRRNPDKVLDMKLRREYGLSLVEYRAMAEAQGNACAICHQPCRTGARLAVDHCHATGRVRALLCRACNTVIGLMQEDPARLLSAADYVTKQQGVNHG